MPGLRCDGCGEFTVPFGGEEVCQCGGRCPGCRRFADDGHDEDCWYDQDEEED